ncbi:MAG: hypothetical protein HYY01_14090 [Chloroflexi bacterium]|nr:hypothetical protein [Chloroflexota bacterium]
MRSITELKSLGDIRTTISTHARSTPRHKGTTYLEILSLGMERQRLQAELAAIAKRQHRIEARVAEINTAILKLVNQVEEESSSVSSPPPSPARGTPAPNLSSIPPKSRMMSLEY